MGKTAQTFAALLVVGSGVAFGLAYVKQSTPPVPAQQPPEIVGPWQPHFSDSVAASIAERLSGQVARYYGLHGQFPTAENFWQTVGVAPIFNPLNGKSEVVAMRFDLDATEVGWVYDTASGAVYPGFTFNRGQPLTQPTTQPD